MMKAREKSLTLRIMEVLNQRMRLDTKARWYLIKLLEGYEGELALDACMEKLLKGGIILKDVRVKTPAGSCQIDTIVIKGKIIFIYEVKSLIGEHIYGKDTLCRLPDTVFDNPELQLTKIHTRMMSLLKRAKLNFRIVKKVVYINPTMTMYQAPESNDFLMHGQLEKHFSEVNAIPNYPSAQLQQLLQVIGESYWEDIRFEDIPAYNFEGLKKGIYCEHCGSYQMKVHRNNCSCLDCHSNTKNMDLLHKNISEIRLLFPEMTLSTKNIKDWCNGVYQERRIQRALEKICDKLFMEKKQFVAKMGKDDKLRLKGIEFVALFILLFIVILLEGPNGKD